jgi:hypothetical protein
MIKINESFTCEQCGHLNPPASKTCRNHCKKCLYSKHVDLKTPGDRKCTCHGLMAPSRITYNSKKGQMIVFDCIKCRKQQLNKLASDDDMTLITEIMRQTSTLPPM